MSSYPYASAKCMAVFPFALRASKVAPARTAAFATRLRLFCAATMRTVFPFRSRTSGETAPLESNDSTSPWRLLRALLKMS